jgi:hypothetical protein
MGYSLFVTGLTHHNARQAFDGYTVYSAMSGDAVYLINMQGKVVHEWAAPAGTRIFYGNLLSNGNLLTNCTNGTEMGGGAGPRTAVVAEMDWQGKSVWYYVDESLHHAHCRLANGNTMVIATHVLSDEQARRVLRLAADSPVESQIWSEALWEITPEGKAIWQWHAIDHLDPAQYVLPNEPGRVATALNAAGSREWLHLNAVEELPDGDLMLSFNTLSTVIIVDRATGAVKWRCAPETSSQHNPTWLGDGRVLLFDNGSRRNYSRILEIDRDANEVSWEYTGDPRDSFYSMNISGAQRLLNGNTLITEGRSGRLFEVTRAGETVWEYINPFEFPHRGQRSRSVFRAYRYAADSPQIRNRV